MSATLHRVSYAQRSMLWGGNRLADLLGIEKPLSPLAEVFAFSALEPDPSVFLEGPFEGLSIIEVYQKHPALFGYPKHTSFPLLIKFIDAQSDLSIQVHPDDAYALQHENSYGKSEAWLILDAEPKSHIYLGHTCKTKDQLKQVIQDNQVLNVLTSKEVKAKDLFNVPAGTLHAINAGIILYEVQQSSMLTYRVYDYDRVDQHGFKRDLHLDKAFDVIRVPDLASQTSIRTLETNDLRERRLENDHFTMRLIEVKESATIRLLKPYSIVGCVSGSGLINGLEFSLGTHALAFNDVDEIEVVGTMSLVLSSVRKEKT